MYLNVPEWQQEAVADQHPQPPQDGEPQADVLEVVVAAGQQVPGLQLFGREAFGHLIVHDALHPTPAEIEDVGHLELRGGPQVPVTATAPDLFDLLLQGGGLLGDEGFNAPRKTRRIVNILTD